MFTLNLITSAINFLVERLKATATKLNNKAAKQTVQINHLIHARIGTMDAANRASSLADNISKLSK